MNASLFFEPPSVDVYNLSFTVQVAMDDDSKHELRVKANSKTSSRRKVGEAEESDASSASDLDAWLTTRDGGRILCKLARIVDDIVTLQTPVQKIPRFLWRSCNPLSSGRPIPMRSSKSGLNCCQHPKEKTKCCCAPRKAV